MTAAWPPGERIVDVAWYKAGALAALAAPAAAAAEPPRSSPDWSGGGDCGAAARLCLLPWAGVPMRRLEQRPGMPPALQEVCKPCLTYVNVPPAWGTPLVDPQQSFLAAVLAMARLAWSKRSLGRPRHLRSRPTRFTLLTQYLICVC